MMLAAKDMSVRTPDGRLLLSGVGFRLDAGRTMFIRGPNGIGKSTLLRTCLGEYRLWEGYFIRQIPEADIAFLPQLQNTQIHLPFTLREVLLTELDVKTLNRHPDLGGLLSEAALKRPWNSASGGERQKTLLLRAILQEKALLILDEPMNHLDAAARSQVAELLSGYTAGGTRSLIIVSHEPESAKLFPGADILDLTECLPC